MTMLRRLLRARFDLWEIFLVAAVAALALWRPQPPANPVQSEKEMDFFRKHYGPGHATEREEEWMIRDFFKDRKNGFFVDVGANHYRIDNKTYYLETVLGWSGLAVEPQRQYGADYLKYRPRTKFFPFFVSNTSDETAKLYVLGDSPLVASSNRDFVRQFGEPDEVRTVPTVTLNDLLDRESVKALDFLSLDIELNEPQALEGFDIERFKPSLVCVEGLLPVRQRILDYFAAHRYVIVGRYIWVDRENLYFMPIRPAPVTH
jgi:FkbM family methyltransferase